MNHGATEQQSNRDVIGLIAGNGTFPLRFAEEARTHGREVIAVAHIGETDEKINSVADAVTWVRVGQLGKLIDVFTSAGVKEVAMAGGINRVKYFDIRLDMRGAALMMKLRSKKDDVIMRGIASEIESEGIEVISSTVYLQQCLVPAGVLTKSKPSAEELEDIEVGREALKSMSAQHIGQTVVVKGGVVTAVEAVEGTDAAIIRGGELAGDGAVIVKCAKTNQDMRFDVPVVGVKTIENLIQIKARVLSLETGRCLIMDREEVIARADKHKISIFGCIPLV